MGTPRRPRPLPPPPGPHTHRVHRAATWPRHRRASAAPQPRRRTLFPLSRCRGCSRYRPHRSDCSSWSPWQAASRRSLGLAQFSPSDWASSSCEYGRADRRLGAAQRRHLWEVGATGTTPSFRSTGIPTSAWKEPTRGAPPASQSTHAQSTDPASHKHVRGGVSFLS